MLTDLHESPPPKSYQTFITIIIISPPSSLSIFKTPTHLRASCHTFCSDLCPNSDPLGSTRIAPKLIQLARHLGHTDASSRAIASHSSAPRPLHALTRRLSLFFRCASLSISASFCSLLLLLRPVKADTTSIRPRAQASLSLSRALHGASAVSAKRRVL